MAYEAAGAGTEIVETAPALADFEAMCASHRARVLGLCRRMLRSDVDAEDALQEVLLRAFRAWPRFRAGTDPWPWLAAIAHNVCRDAGRRSKRAADHGITWTDVAALEEVDLPTAVAPDAYEEVERRGRQEMMREAIAAVPTTYRTPIYLRDIEGWSVSDIAQLRGRSVPSVRSSLNRGRKLLQERVEELAKTRKDWSLPVAVPAAGGLAARWRARAAKMRAGMDRAAATSWQSMDAVIATIGSGKLRGLTQFAGSALAAAAIVTGGGGDGASSAGAAHSPASARPPAIVALAASQTHAAATSTAASQPSPLSTRREPTVTVNQGSVSSERTETPGVVATPGDHGLPTPTSEDTRINLGGVTITCPRPEDRNVLGLVVCGAMDQYPPTED